MKNIDKFTKGEMNENQEKKYLESLYEKHYDNKLKSHYKEKLSSEFNILREDSKKTDTPRKKGTLRFLILGASALAAILAFVLVFLPMMNTDSTIGSKQFAQNLITIDKLDIKRGQQEDSKLRLNIIESYNSGNYSEALTSYEKLSKLTSEDKYFKGRIHLFQKNYRDAIASFTGISDLDTFKYNAELTYWLGVSYAATGEDQLAKPLLEKVTESSWKAAEAKELISKMK